MSHKIHFITYGNNLYVNSKKRLQQESIKSKWFDTITICGPENLSEVFKHEFNDILKNQEELVIGYGNLILLNNI